VGAWGTGIFEDDHALDWVGTLTEATTIVPVVDALRAVETTGYLDASVCSAALAAAEILAALNGKASAALPEDAENWVRNHPLQVNDELLQLARTAIQRIEAESELRDLWAESDVLSEWQAEIKNLESRLSIA
jgi:hypothetical protein